MESANHNKARLIADALHYVRRYHGKTVVIKYGGNAMTDAALQDAFAQDIAMLKLVGIRPVIVHGGGPQIGEALRAAGKESRFINGLRHTDEETMQVVKMTLGGAVNQDIVRLINRHGGRAVGLTGDCGGLLTASRLAAQDDAGKPVDIGLVGNVAKVDSRLLSLLEQDGYTPVIAPIAADESGQTLNINADTAAAKLAVALGAEALFLLTNTAGVLSDKGDLLPRLSAAEARQLIAAGTIGGGMRPKVECGIDAVLGGARSCQIINGTAAHSLLLEVFTDEGAGTFISP